MRGPKRRGKREEQKSTAPPPPPAKGAETRNDAVSAQSAWSPGGSLRTRRLWRDEEKRHAPFIIPSMIFRQITQTQGWRSAMPNSGISPQALRPPRNPKSAKAERGSLSPSPAPGPSGSSSAQRGRGTERPLEDYEKEHPGTVRLNTLFPATIRRPVAKARNGTAPRSQWVCAAVLNSQGTRESAAGPAKGRESERWRRAPEYQSPCPRPPLLPLPLSPERDASRSPAYRGLT